MDTSNTIENVIVIKDLQTGFGSYLIHDHLQLEVKKGEILGIVGGSGSGKSVLLRTIIGLEKKHKGLVNILGYNLDNLSSRKQSQLLRRIGVLFQGSALFSSMTVAENIQVPLKENYKLSQNTLDELAYFKMMLVGLPQEAYYKYPSELSGGMKKRAGLARALVLEPEILFLDEPTAGLDPIGAADFDQLILNLQQSLGLTVFMITHDLDSLVSICDRIAALVDKKIIVGTFDDFRYSEHPWIKEYFQGPRARAVIGGKSGNKS
ncbi:MAG: ABC transporter ATP-binding protein [Alphaproteobacteria bacterium]|nr:ABC transporter ATP-binding protein [Alphaproteobacteria bacterium]